MAKRLTDTDKWDKAWFCSLSKDDKLFWVYLMDKCNHAGIWQVNWSLVQFHIPGFHFVAEVFGKRIEVISPTKWFINKFVSFQYGALNPANQAHKSVLKLLEKEGVVGLSPHSPGSDKDKDKDKDKVSSSFGEYENLFLQAWEKYPKRIGKKEAKAHFIHTVKTREDFNALCSAIKYYMDSKEYKDGFIKNGSTFFAEWEDWRPHDGGHDRTGVSELATIVSRAREARRVQGLRKVTTHAALPVRVRDAQVDQSPLPVISSESTPLKRN